MKEYFLPFTEHNDFGFGIIAGAYKDASEILYKNKNNDRYWYSNFPINFLRRHSIELYLKSIIVLFSKRLCLVEDAATIDDFVFERPNGKLEMIKKSHDLELMYNYTEFLINNNISKLEELHMEDWTFPKQLGEYIRKLSGYDYKSDYFRYPMSRDASRDSKKDVFKEMSYDELIREAKSPKGKLFMLFEDENGNISKMFNNVDEDNFSELLLYILENLFCYQAQIRYTLFAD